MDDGVKVGNCVVGLELGDKDVLGIPDGCFEGTMLGDVDGDILGKEVGSPEAVGDTLGKEVGSPDAVGIEEGGSDGAALIDGI